MAECRSCGAKVLWVTMAGTGKANPLDAEPSDKGNVEVTYDTGQPVGTVVTNEDRLFPVPLYLSHFATCPDAESHRRKK